MTTKKDNYLMALRGERPEWVPCFPADANLLFPDAWHKCSFPDGTDMFGIKWVDEGPAGQMPDPNHRSVTDIARWRDSINVPPLSEWDWKGMKEAFDETYDPDKITYAMPTPGIFITPINMMGWVDGLCAIYEHPDELREMVDYLTDLFIATYEYVVDICHPDVICAGDDFAGADGPFISEEVWEDFYKPYCVRIADAIHSYGAFAEFHCCGNCGYLTEKFLDAGYDVVQVPMPNDRLLEDRKRLGKRLVVTGGWDRRGPGAMAGAPEEVVRQSARDAIDKFAPDGGFVFSDGGVIVLDESYERKLEWLYDEVDRYGHEIYS